MLLARSIYGELNAPAAGAPFARQDPQLPQGFYAIDPLVRILPGDRLRATCDFDSANEVGRGQGPAGVGRLQGGRSLAAEGS